MIEPSTLARVCSALGDRSVVEGVRETVRAGYQEIYTSHLADSKD